MTQSPAGWHPDPWGAPDTLRYWDGQQWTGHLSPTGPVAPAYDAAKPGPTTADGQPLAEWWQRLVAYLIDSFAAGSVSWILGIPFYLAYLRGLNNWVDEMNRATASGAPAPNVGDFFHFVGGPLLGVLAVNLVVIVVYQLVMLAWRQQTLGMMAFGLRVRLVDDPGLPVGRVLLRVLVQYGVGLVCTGIFILLDGLWPLWDRRRQSLHDKAAGTVVVKTL